MKYQVWDDQSDDEEFSREIDATEPEHAATEYADQDCDGQADGMYFDGPSTIHVRDPSTDKLFKFEVSGEMEPTFRARSVTTSSGGEGEGNEG